MELIAAAPGVEAIVPKKWRDSGCETSGCPPWFLVPSPVWTADGTMLFSSPDTNSIYRWSVPGLGVGLPVLPRLLRRRHRSLPPTGIQCTDPPLRFARGHGRCQAGAAVQWVFAARAGDVVLVTDELAFSQTSDTSWPTPTSWCAASRRSTSTPIRTTKPDFDPTTPEVRAAWKAMTR